jgi:predicted acetyltransferase
MSDELEFDIDDILEDKVAISDKREITVGASDDSVSEESAADESQKEIISRSSLSDEPVVEGSAEDIEHLRNRLRSWNENCRDLFVDLRAMDFSASSEDSSIEFKDKGVYAKRLYFKVDPQNPKDPKTTHAQQQFCKMLGVPHPFFIANRPTLKMNIVRTWQSGLSASETKAQCIMKIRESADCSIIRAFIPVTKCPIMLHELINTIMDTVTIPITMEFAYGDDKDDLTLHARFLFGKRYELFEERIPVCLGFSLVASELDASPMSVDVLLHDLTHKASFLTTYGNDPFFKSKYEGIKTSQIKDVLSKMLTRIDEDALDILNSVSQKVENAKKEIFIAEDEAARLMRSKGFSEKIKKALYHQITECEDKIHTPYDLAVHAGLVAKDLDSLKRLDIERAAGKYLWLVFSKE